MNTLSRVCCKNTSTRLYYSRGRSCLLSHLECEEKVVPTCVIVSKAIPEPQAKVYPRFCKSLRTTFAWCGQRVPKTAKTGCDKVEQFPDFAFLPKRITSGRAKWHYIYPETSLNGWLTIWVILILGSLGAAADVLIPCKDRSKELHNLQSIKYMGTGMKRELGMHSKW